MRGQPFFTSSGTAWHRQANEETGPRPKNILDEFDTECQFQSVNARVEIGAS